MKLFTIALASLATLLTFSTAKIVSNPPRCYRMKCIVTQDDKCGLEKAIPQGSGTPTKNAGTGSGSQIGYDTFTFSDTSGKKQFHGKIGNDGSMEMTVGGQTNESELYRIGFGFNLEIYYFYLDGNSNCKSPPRSFDEYLPGTMEITAIMTPRG